MNKARQTPEAFLSGSQWAGSERVALAGDASARRYFRLSGPRGSPAILMDAPRDVCGSQEDFLRITAHLRSIGLAAPEVIRTDLNHGYILMEDLGDDLFAQVAPQSEEAEIRLYSIACDVLVHLHRPPPAGLERQTPEGLANMVMIVFSHYCAGTGQTVDEETVADFHRAFRQVLSEALKTEPVLVLRDFHAENLIWRPEQHGLQRAGLLDFQDALAGHPAYDLVSLLQDARRDLRPGLEEVMIRRYLAATGRDPEAFRFAYHVIGVQRHLRILGVFARLCMEMGKHRYLDFVPRTWAHLRSCLAHPRLTDLSDMLMSVLPEPEPAMLERLRTG